MKKITTITLREQAGLSRTNEPLYFGVPLPRGVARTAAELRLADQTDEPLVADIVPALYWPDQSLRWVHVHTLNSQPAGETRQLRLCTTDSLAAPPVDGSETSSSLAFTKGSLTWQDQDPAGAGYAITLKDEAGNPCQAQCTGTWTRAHQGAVAQTHSISGDWLRSDGTRLARFTCEVTSYSNTRLQNVTVCLHNPRRARHPGGLWDLGDPGSVHFQSLTVHATRPDSGKAVFCPEPGPAGLTVNPEDTLRLHQESSGGEHWNSLNHVNANGKLLPQYRGYRLYQGEKEVSAGLRASPLVALSGGNGQTLRASYPKFWQNFPSAIEAGNGTLSLELFPGHTAEPHELQGGERKTQTLWFETSDHPDSLNWTHQPLVAAIDARDHAQARSFPWFSADAPASDLDALIRPGLEGDQSFFAKREIIDEYGWRNFGDIFADHETLYQPPGEPPLISHYNNQYDAIYGFARQFALTGDTRWFELMDDLARHVTDIDIYHTDEDRAEYNHGLFWHTDHYLPAHTATHRTFTRHNDTSSTPGQTGGGPAAEHCYTTGLLYHFLMTGNTGSRSAVLGLARWMVSLHDGSRGLLAQLLAVKKQEVPKLKALIRGERPSAHQYPFTRGTGNYLTALLDAATLEPGKDWLQKAGQVIRETIHPADDIEARNLLDVETGWSYLILLAAIFRYLWTKRELGETDETYHYARQSLLHYTAWMKANERPFLQDPEPLEFANDTWVAQDIRKAMLMFNAAELCQGKEAEDYLATGQQWQDQVCQTLQKSPEKHFSRILVILAQNYGPQTAGSMADASASAVSHSLKEPSAPILTWPQLVARILQRLGAGLTQFRPSREKAWLDARMNR